VPFLVEPRHRRDDAGDRTEVTALPHGKDKGGEKHTKRTAQKNLKQKRAEKRAKRTSGEGQPIHIQTTQS
jgi:hypothetical protein